MVTGFRFLPLVLGPAFGLILGFLPLTAFSADPTSFSCEPAAEGPSMTVRAFSGYFDVARADVPPVRPEEFEPQIPSRPSVPPQLGTQTELPTFGCKRLYARKGELHPVDSFHRQDGE